MMKVMKFLTVLTLVLISLWLCESMFDFVGIPNQGRLPEVLRDAFDLLALYYFSTYFEKMYERIVRKKSDTESCPYCGSKSKPTEE